MFEIDPVHTGELRHKRRYLHVNSTNRQQHKWDAHRAFDLALVLLSAPISMLIVFLAAVPLVPIFGRNVLFRQIRLGKDGKHFSVVKLRTLDELSLKPINTYCAFLRRHSIDELPQLWNVLAGDMALVGPRCHVPGMVIDHKIVDELSMDYQQRLRVRPGMTGLAQVHGNRGPIRDPKQLLQRLTFDLAYIQNQSIWLDMTIIAQTIIKEIFVGTGE